MALRTLEDARDGVTSLAVHTSSGEFGLIKLDRAIQSSAEELAEYCSCIRLTTGVTVAANATSIDPTGTAGLVDWVMDDFIHAYIGDDPVPSTSIQSIRRRRGSAKPAKPTHLSVERRDLIELHPKNDGTERTLNITHRTVSVTDDSWTLGTSSPELVSLKIPHVLWGRWLKSGVKYYLLHGLNFIHPDVEVSYKEWLRFLKYAKTMFPLREPPLNDYQGHPSREKRQGRFPQGAGR